MLELPTTKIPGIATEKRELRSSKTNEVFAYMVKVQALGLTYDVRVPGEAFGKINEGDTIIAHCRHESYMGNVQFIADKVEHVRKAG